MTLNFNDAAEYLVPRLGGGKKWSLGPTTELLDYLGNPHEQFATIHVAGTNGKGTVAGLIAAALRRAGHNVGLYTSPHLVSLRERVVVNGRAIGEDAFASWTNHLRAEIEKVNASFFEAYTAIAFADFAARGVDVAVVEVGLGGRLDSTNVLRPMVSIITNVGSDHASFLGDSVERIAWEKAHVAKSSTPLIVGETDPELQMIIGDVALEIGAHVRVVDAALRYEGPLVMAASYQRRNAVVARAALHAVPPEFRPNADQLLEAFATFRIPGRFDRRGKWLFDMAHNRPAIEGLVAEVGFHPLPHPVHAVLGVMSDKDCRSIVSAVASICDTLWLTVPPSAPRERVWSPEDWVAAAGIPVHVEPDIDLALTHAQAGAGSILVTGSAYTVGDVMARLPGFAPLG